MLLGDGMGLAAAGANVVMQLSMLPIGRAVVESGVESGRLDRHPIKRTRTTLTFLAVAAAGEDGERRELRRQIDRVHALVRSAPGAPTRYRAFDPELQLWVAACIYHGIRDVRERLHGPLSPGDADALYRASAVFGTTLQVPPRLWPASRAEFDRYWSESLRRIQMDDATRRYLRDLTELRFLPRPLAGLLGPANRFVTLGFLPAEFRQPLGLPWTGRHQRRFDRMLRAGAAVNRRLPAPVRAFPFNALLWHARRRVRRGQPIL